ncbi:hypothetical protein [Bacillus sp. REN10]|uniref:hypothetical protein n=1 Tax=Bacillus sp. REN10 TaxID=2782541 RepID=UPI00193AEE89|nr:hypothetical protein [Bacillus sp. REN10]
MKNVMVRAWEIARQGVVKFGGKVKEYFAQALTMAWAEAKNTAKKSVKEVAEMIQNKLSNEVKVNVWEKYGKRRIYVNKGFKQQVAMLEFDAQDNFIGRKLGAMDLFGARQNGVEDELIAVYEVVEAIA